MASFYPEWSRTKTILALSLPIVGGMVSQNVLNLVDTAMVGSLGDAALAATGVGSFANFTTVAFVMGLSSGVQAMSSRRLGEGRTNEVAVPLNGALLQALAIGLPLAIGGYLAAPILFPYLNGDPEVIANGVPYLQARLCGLVAVGINFAFRGYWNGINRSTVYFRSLLIMHAVNIFLNWVLIFGKFGAPAMGAEGAGWATAISAYVGTTLYVLQGLSLARVNGFLKGLPDWDTMVTMTRLAVPNGIQQFLFAAGLTTLFWMLGQVGTAETAAGSALVNLMLVAILPGIAMGLAAASLVGQDLGRGNPDGARQWGWDVSKVGSSFIAPIGLTMVLFPHIWLSPFLHDPATLAIAEQPLQLFGAFIGLDATGMILMNALLGAGAARQVATVSIGLQWGLYLPIAYLIGPVWGYGLLGMWAAQIAYRNVLALVFTTLWYRGKWASIQV